MLRWIKTIILLSIFFFVTVWVYTNSETLRHNAIAIVKDRLFKATGLHMEANHVAFSFPPKISVHGLSVRDSNYTLLFTSDQVSVSVDMGDILKRDISKVHAVIDEAVLYSIPENKNHTSTTLKIPELFLTVNHLIIDPAAANALPLNETYFTSLNLKNVVFHSLDGTHEISGNIIADSLRINELSSENLFTYVQCQLTKAQLSGKAFAVSEINGKKGLINTDFDWTFGKQLHLESSQLKYDDLEVLNLALQLEPGSQLSVSAKKAIFQDVELSNPGIKATLGQTSENHSFELQTEGTWKERPFKFEVAGGGNYNNEQLQIDINSLKGTAEAASFALLKPSRVTAEKDRFSMTPLVLALDQMSLNSSLQIANNNFLLKGTIAHTDYPQVDFSAQIPVEFSLTPFSFSMNKDSPLSGKLVSSGAIAPILQKLLDSPTTFAGNAQAEMNLGGTIDSPLITGNCKISNGAYEIPAIGVSLKNLTANIEAKGPQLTITSIEAFDGKGGRVYGTGFFHIDKDQKNPFALELTLNESALFNQDYIQVICNGPLLFKGNGREGSLEGRLQVSKANVLIPDRSSSSINTVDVTYVNIPENAPKPQSYILKETSWPLALDIHLTVPRTLSVQGRDLDSYWKGELVVQGLAKAPLLFGELKIVTGQYLFNGNPFFLNQGVVTFAGDFDKKTTLYVIANKDLDKVKVDVIAKGPLKNPVISFRSNPPLPQREILSWILFNRGTSEISPFQGAQLSESITNLSTQQQGPDVLSKIRSLFKIDRFEISRNPQSDDNSVNVEVGKYISDNILISVIKSDVNRVALEANLTDNIKLRGQVGDDSQGQLFLKWKKDY